MEGICPHPCASHRQAFSATPADDNRIKAAAAAATNHRIEHRRATSSTADQPSSSEYTGRVPQTRAPVMGTHVLCRPAWYRSRQAPAQVWRIAPRCRRDGAIADATFPSSSRVLRPLATPGDAHVCGNRLRQFAKQRLPLEAALHQCLLLALLTR